MLILGKKNLKNGKKALQTNANEVESSLGKMSVWENSQGNFKKIEPKKSEDINVLIEKDDRKQKRHWNVNKSAALNLNMYIKQLTNDERSKLKRQNKKKKNVK